jgi:hypothetical protein
MGQFIPDRFFWARGDDEEALGTGESATDGTR